MTRPWHWVRHRWRLVVGALPPRPVIAAEALEFQDEIEIIISEPEPPILGTPHRVLAVMLVLGAVVASIVQIDMVVVGSGRLMTQEPAIVLQPMERSVVRDIRVKAGDIVRKGQVLATLDPTFTLADRSSLTAQQRALFARLRRLETEAAGLSELPVPVGDPGPELLLQSELLRQRAAQYASRLRSFDGEISGIQASLKTAGDDRKSLTEQLTVTRDVESLREQLFEAQTGSRLLLLEARSVRLQTERSLQNTINSLEELRQSMLSKQAQRQAFIDEWQRMLLEELAATRTEAIQIDEQLAKAVRLNDLVELIAPSDAIVQEVAKRSPGSVSREAEAMVTLIPLGSPLVAEITIGSRDIGYVRAGHDVAIKIDAFPYQKHGMLPGRLRSISQESFAANGAVEQTDALRAPVPAGAGAVHRAQVELLDPNAIDLPEGAHLTAGMTLHAEIKVGSRSLMSYFLYPILRGLSESIREP